eukprot:Gb_32460 [translate_table: standard]
MVVELLVIVIFLARPSCSTEAFSTFIPRSPARKSAPVIIAISWSKAFRLSPKPGALIAATLIIPRNLFTTNVASASPERSSATISSGTLNCVVFSSIGIISLIVVIFWSVTKTLAFSNSTTNFSWLVTNWGDM